MTEKTDSKQIPITDGSEDDEFKVDDRRHWADDDADANDADATPVAPARPSVIEEYRQRAEKAEQTLQEYIEAHKKFKLEQDQVRERLNQRVEQEVSLKFGGLVEEQLEFLDDMERAMSHAQSSDDQASLLEGLEIARRRFLATLQEYGVEPFTPTGEAFDPNRDEALRVDTLASPEQDGLVTETFRPGYMLKDRVLRVARVAVGRHVKG